MMKGPIEMFQSNLHENIFALTYFTLYIITQMCQDNKKGYFYF